MPTAHLTTSGNIISDDFVEWLCAPGAKHDALRAPSFTGPDGVAPSSVDTVIAAAYETLRDRWEAIRNDVAQFDLTQLRQRWVLPALRALEFDPQFERGTTRIGDLEFNLSHRGWAGPKAPFIHSVPWQQDLDQRPGSPRHASSPHDLVQRFLNVSPKHDWAICTNGRALRILRVYHQTLTKGFIQADLAGIFESGNVADFRALFRLAHASRFIARDGTECPLELFHSSSRETGVEVGRQLRAQVREAIQTLGNGFLAPELAARLQADPAATRAYYQELLQLVYRLLFLLFVEQKGWAPLRNRIYRDTYSVSSLRERATDPNALRDESQDLWEGLKITFGLFRDGFAFNEAERIPAYGGQLFDPRRLATLEQCTQPNRSLLEAIERLTYFTRQRTRYRINYAQLRVDELGSVYEALLDYTPRVLGQPEEIEGQQYGAGSFVLDPRGTGRKTTGSYYTDQRLVAELIKSALEPVIEDRLASATTDAERERAILSIKVCDPACGSAAFLTAAMDALGARLATIRAGGEQPVEQELRRARRDVLQRCIYGVDLNPMAVELAKVSLWIHATMPDLPLNFLDNKIRCGNSLIGIPPPGAVREARELAHRAGEDFVGWPDAIPDAAFDPVTGDDKTIARDLKQRNRRERGSRGGPGQLAMDMQGNGKLSAPFRALLDLPERNTADVDAKAAKYDALRGPGSVYWDRRTASHLWAAAFFWPKRKDVLVRTGGAPTTGVLQSFQRNPGAGMGPMVGEAFELVDRYAFFHWPLEFPDVFGTNGEGGFHCILGNPPWDQMQFDPREFFRIAAPDIAEAPSMAARDRMLARLRDTQPDLMTQFDAGQERSDREKNFVHASGRFPLTSFGRLNLAPLFAELAGHLLAPGGHAGVTVPSGIATDAFNQYFFDHTVSRGGLVTLYDFENSRAIFPGVHRSYKFCLLTLSRKPVPAGDFVFFATDTDHLADARRRFKLSAEDFALLNPNTRTCPVFRTREDAELVKKIYRLVPVLVREARDGRPEENPWGVRFMLMFMMNTDSHLFQTRRELEAQGYRLRGNVFTRSGAEDYLPLYEAKMIHQFDHRYATYEGVSDDDLKVGQAREVTDHEKADTSFVVLPRYWVRAVEVESRLQCRWNESWLLGFRDIARATDERTAILTFLPIFRDITNATNERTAICSLVPCTAVGNNAPLLLPAKGIATTQVLCLVACVNSLPFDFVARQKVAGTHMNFYVVNQLPFLAPSAFNSADIDFVASRALELVHTSNDLDPLRTEMGSRREPFGWNAKRRTELRAELDAYCAHLYGLSRDDLRYILDPQDVLGPDYPGETFRVLKQNELKRYGEYRTRRLVLEAWDRLFGER